MGIQLIKNDKLELKKKHYLINVFGATFLTEDYFIYQIIKFTVFLKESKNKTLVFFNSTDYRSTKRVANKMTSVHSAR